MNPPDLASQPDVALDENLNENRDRTGNRPLIVAGLVLGLGQGGFFDGIVFHQLLQWHHMFSSVKTDMTVAGLELNTIGDGLFHLFDWVMTLSGLFLLWRAGQQATSWSGRVLLGAVLMGAGIFNFVEGVLDHHLLGIHHLKPGPNQLLWDLSFLASGVILVVVGLALVRSMRSSQSSQFSKR
jgi:uncharacterized membrane protein